MKKLAKKGIKRIIKHGNKLMKSVVNSATNPLGIPEYANVKFNRFIISEIEINLKPLNKTHLTDQIANYFTTQADKEINLALEKYNRPVTRGRDGLLYSQADMDMAMMGY